jgi:hypothetical protein
MRTMTLALAATSLAAALVSANAMARDNVSFSISLGVPGPVYAAPAPVYVVPSPAYYPPAPAYYPPAPIYSSAPIYGAAPVYYYPPRAYAPPRVVYAPQLMGPAAVVSFGGRGGYARGHGHGHDRRHWDR